MTTASALAPGICSVTFRDLPVGQIVDLANAAGMAGIEWGADVHVPPGDLVIARDAARRTVDEGLAVASYGSYLFASRSSVAEVDAVLETAVALGTDLVRVWCPFADAAASTGPARDEIVDALGVMAAAARRAGLVLYLEFHGGTLTASAASARAVLDAVGAENLAVAWQPPYWAVDPADRSLAASLDAVSLLAPWLAHLHVYEWHHDGTRDPLVLGADHWPALLDAASLVGRADVARFALIEFVRGDSPASFRADARTLRTWLGLES